MPTGIVCQHKAPVLIIGSGVAGLLTALKLAEAGVASLLVTKTHLAESNTRYAQGGIAAVLPTNKEDSIELHVQDTLIAGCGLNNPELVKDLLGEGAAAIDDLIELGVLFDKAPDDQLALTREAAHSVRRIVHAGGDSTGQSLETALVKRVKASSLITVIQQTAVIQLWRYSNGAMGGAWAVDLAENQWLRLVASRIVLATGGLGQLYSHTTNPVIATGDGLALASRLSLPIEGMEFIQFHPTGFYHKGKVHFLISEAFRGEGGRLKNHRGEYFATRYHPDGELAPRDVVTRAIFQEMAEQQSDHVWLDMNELPHDWLVKRFPSLHRQLLNLGIDMREQDIPVAPAAHYAMGGVQVTAHGKTDQPGLYAVGEVAHTGLHGANRLASNSLLECLVLARRVAADIITQVQNSAQFAGPMGQLESDPHPEAPYALRQPAEESLSRIAEARDQLQQCMWRYVGALRTPDGLQLANETVTYLQRECYSKGWETLLPQGLELSNLLCAAQYVIQAAQRRETSLGAHYIEPLEEAST